MAQADRLMADVARIAVASFWFDLGSRSIQLFPGIAEEAVEEFETDRGAERTKAHEIARSVRDQRAALELLAGAGPRSVTARRHAIHAIERVGGRGAARHVDVHAFGLGWRDLPRLALYPGIAARSHADRAAA